MTGEPFRYLTVIEPEDHGGVLNRDTVARFTDGFSKPAVFRGLVPIPPELATRAFYEGVSDEAVQWRRKSGAAAATLRSEDGKADYNYVSGTVGTGQEFLDDIFVHQRDVYSHLGTISAGYKDPYPWGKIAFSRVREAIFRSGWFQVDGWQPTGHMFFGHSSQDYGEPSGGAVGSDWHMFPTLNVFVMIAGRKRWMTRPAAAGEQLWTYDNMFPTSSGREAPGRNFDDYETVHLEPGDALLNLPYEWHKVLNARGLSLGAAFRIIDHHYLDHLQTRPAVAKAVPNLKAGMNEDLLHLLTSLRYASHHIRRAQMMLNEIEYVYPAMIALKTRLDAMQQGAALERAH